jgi:hypothetical protein
MTAPRDLAAEARAKADTLRSYLRPATALLLTELADRITELEGKVEHWTERTAMAGQGLGRHIAELEAQLADAQRGPIGYSALVQANGSTQLIPMDLTRVKAEQCAAWHNGISPDVACVVELREVTE